MPRRNGGENSKPLPRRRTATTPEGREAQIISLAYDLAEKRILEGTATSQEVTHFLKLGSSREKLEQERLMHENLLTQAKIKELESQKDMAELYGNAINAMRAYSGQEPTDQQDEYDG